MRRSQSHGKHVDGIGGSVSESLAELVDLGDESDGAEGHDGGAGSDSSATEHGREYDQSPPPPQASHRREQGGLSDSDDGDRDVGSSLHVSDGNRWSFDINESHDGYGGRNLSRSRSRSQGSQSGDEVVADEAGKRTRRQMHIARVEPKRLRHHDSHVRFSDAADSNGGGDGGEANEHDAVLKRAAEAAAAAREAAEAAAKVQRLASEGKRRREEGQRRAVAEAKAAEEARRQQSAAATRRRAIAEAEGAKQRLAELRRRRRDEAARAVAGLRKNRESDAARRLDAALEDRHLRRDLAVALAVPRSASSIPAMCPIVVPSKIVDSFANSDDESDHGVEDDENNDEAGGDAWRHGGVPVAAWSPGDAGVRTPQKRLQRAMMWPSTGGAVAPSPSVMVAALRSVRAASETARGAWSLGYGVGNAHYYSSPTVGKGDAVDPHLEVSRAALAGKNAGRISAMSAAPGLRVRAGSVRGGLAMKTLLWPKHGAEVPEAVAPQTWSDEDDGHQEDDDYDYDDDDEPDADRRAKQDVGAAVLARAASATAEHKTLSAAQGGSEPALGRGFGKTGELGPLSRSWQHVQLSKDPFAMLKSCLAASPARRTGGDEGAHWMTDCSTVAVPAGTIAGLQRLPLGSTLVLTENGMIITPGDEKAAAGILRHCTGFDVTAVLPPSRALAPRPGLAAPVCLDPATGYTIRLPPPLAAMVPAFAAVAWVGEGRSNFAPALVMAPALLPNTAADVERRSAATESSVSSFPTAAANGQHDPPAALVLRDPSVLKELAGVMAGTSAAAPGSAAPSGVVYRPLVFSQRTRAWLRVRPFASDAETAALQSYGSVCVAVPPSRSPGEEESALPAPSAATLVFGGINARSMDTISARGARVASMAATAVWVGLDDDDTFLSDVVVTILDANLPGIATGRAFHSAAASAAGRVVVYGGLVPGAGEVLQVSDDLFELDFAAGPGGKATVVDDGSAPLRAVGHGHGPGGRFLASVSVLGDALLVAGGFKAIAGESGRFEACHDMWVLSLESNVWARARIAASPSLPIPLLGPVSGAALVIGKHPVLILGGPQTSSDGEASSASGRASVVVLSLPRAPLEDMSQQLDDVAL